MNQIVFVVYLFLLLTADAIFAQTNDIVLFDFEVGKLAQWIWEGKNFLVSGNPVHAHDIASWAYGPVGFKRNYYIETGHNEGRHTINPKGLLIR